MDAFQAPATLLGPPQTSTIQGRLLASNVLILTLPITLDLAVSISPLTMVINICNSIENCDG